MPKPGQKSITVKQQTYELAKEKARQEGYVNNFGEPQVAPFVTDLIKGKRKRKEA
jgi:hypothetical protein